MHTYYLYELFISDNMQILYYLFIYLLFTVTNIHAVVTTETDGNLEKQYLHHF